MTWIKSLYHVAWYKRSRGQRRKWICGRDFHFPLYLVWKTSLMIINSWAEVWYGYDSRPFWGYSIWLNKKFSIKLCRETLLSSEVLTVIFQVLSNIAMHLCSMCSYPLLLYFKKFMRFLSRSHKLHFLLFMFYWF